MLELEPESPGHHFEKGSDLRMLSVYQAQCLLAPGASCPAGLAPHGHSPACAMSPIPSSAFLPPRTCLNSLVSWVWQTPASSGRVKRGQSVGGTSSRDVRGWQKAPLLRCPRHSASRSLETPSGRGKGTQVPLHARPPKRDTAGKNKTTNALCKKWEPK